MNEKQPEALRLAAILGNEFDTYTDTWSAKEAAGELLRLHEVNVELLGALKKAQEDINWMLNSRQFLNRFVFNYIDESIAKATKGQE